MPDASVGCARDETAQRIGLFRADIQWEHDILVEKILPRQEGAPYPIVLEGKRACPPEDVGGPWGYTEYLEAIRDPNHERHNEMLEWGGEFDPEAYDP
jgi:hypothetical protein